VHTREGQYIYRYLLCVWISTMLAALFLLSISESRRRHFLDTHLRTTKVASKATYADSIHSCGSKRNAEHNTEPCIFKKMQKKLGRVKPPRLFPATTFKNPKIFCYTIASYPYPDTLPMVMNALSLGCDRWHAFSSHASPPNITKVYNQV
jgi:hypothetical protein